MNAPLLWIGLPLVLSALFFLLPRERWITWLSTLTALTLAALAYWLPPGTAQRIGTLSLRIEPSFSLLGRQLTLDAGDQTLLLLVYGMAAFWFFGTLAAGGARQVAGLGLAVIALLMASLAVRPFLYAALFIEVAVLVAIPLLAPPTPKQRAGPMRGLLRFLISQTFAMPFILLAGFLLSGVEAGPADVAQVVQAGILLLIGFAFLLAVFPLNTWIPLLAEEASPYALGFLLTMLNTFGLILALNFIDRFSWLRNSSQLPTVLQLVGIVTCVTAGVWAAFQRHLGRIAAYALIAETGVSLLAISLPDRQTGLQILFYLFLPRALALGVWTMSINILQATTGDLRFSAVQGLVRQYPAATAGVVFANLTLAGTPLLASFPVRQALWEHLAAQSLPLAFWFGIASLGLWLMAFRSLAVLTLDSSQTEWNSRESWPERILIGLGLLALFVLGLFPQLAQPLLHGFPAMFDFLGK
ncbi:MAG: proton-conducting transporter membrane subunit [Anaerolineales bacterium]|nr:hypothetical protein [Anaerolineales bacterium]MCX7753995.1 proton-conducting transporter membrane subunit [Anaerolineales bacterium]MDW8276799.1 proton-conducting transporter membrane subunit [Anaerolineales bacterium]